MSLTFPRPKAMSTNKEVLGTKTRTVPHLIIHINKSQVFKACWHMWATWKFFLTLASMIRACVQNTHQSDMQVL